MIDEQLIAKLRAKFGNKTPRTWRKMARHVKASWADAMREIAWRLDNDPEELKKQAIAFFESTTERTERRLLQLHKNRAKRIESYGLTVEQYDSMLEGQNFACAICGQVTDLVIDHDHATGAVRGLLCNDCNKGIGMFRDNTDRMAAAVAYLKANQHKGG